MSIWLLFPFLVINKHLSSKLIGQLDMFFPSCLCLERGVQKKTFQITISPNVHGVATASDMFKREQSRALLMFVLSCLPILCELHAEMKTVVSWKISIIILFYMLFAFKAGSPHTGKESFPIYMQCCKACLCCVVAYAWMSLIFSIDETLVTCLILQAKGKQDNHFADCQRYGLHTKCLESISFLNKMNAAVSRCPSSLLGSSLGTFYLLSTVLCRFIPAAIYGLWNLYTWTELRFRSKSSHSHTEEAASSLLKPRTYPSNKGLLLCSIVLLSCILVEAGIPRIKQLSSFHVILPFIGILCLQSLLHKYRHRDSTKIILIDLQRICIYVCIFFSSMDFVINCMMLMSQCLGARLDIDKIRNDCINTHGPRGVEDCYKSIGQIDVSSNSYPNYCPLLGKPETTILYTANVLQVITLSIGIALLCMIRKEIE